MKQVSRDTASASGPSYKPTSSLGSSHQPHLVADAPHGAGLRMERETLPHLLEMLVSADGASTR